MRSLAERWFYLKRILNSFDKLHFTITVSTKNFVQALQALSDFLNSFLMAKRHSVLKAKIGYRRERGTLPGAEPSKRTSNRKLDTLINYHGSASDILSKLSRLNSGTYIYLDDEKTSKHK